ncbi:MAG: hypothetical protein KAS23_13065 [Anaerohalosphaera sp.]|nr:hypothetical protein [Anaerohalosphaera sp.]
MKISKIVLLIALSAMLFLSSCSLQRTATTVIDEKTYTWDRLPKLPNTIGVAGPFVGVHNDALIVAGGANFPFGPPWQGGEKVWHSDIYVLEKGTRKWYTQNKLPKPLAYGVTMETEHGVVLAGGCDADKCYDDVSLLRWSPVNKGISITKLPSLPRPTAFCTGSEIGSTIYIVAGQSTTDPRTATKDFWALDLSKPAPERKWVSLEPWPGTPINKSLAVTQKADGKEYMYLFGGEYATTDSHNQIHRQYLRDVYRFDPTSNTWDKMSDLPKPLAASQAVSTGDSNIVLISGSSGIHVYKPVNQRPLFLTDIIIYDTESDTYSHAGKMPLGVVTTQATIFDGSIVVPSGEIRPGIRTPLVQRLKLND